VTSYIVSALPQLQVANALTSADIPQKRLAASFHPALLGQRAEESVAARRPSLMLADEEHSYIGETGAQAVDVSGRQ